MKIFPVPGSRRIFPSFRFCLVAVVSSTLASSPIRATETIEPLTIDGNYFKTAAGTPVRFWGMNLVSLFPTHAQADATAANFASLEINIVRPHHDLRKGLDWNTASGIPALVTYEGNTRTPHAEAWDRFDYLNAQLRARSIYLVLSLHGTRRFLPGDVDVLQTSDADRSAWISAMTALTSIPATNNLSLFKMLPMIDERCARLMEEFAQYQLTHVNPYTGVAYGRDPQVLYLETMNETSTEYLILAGNKFESASFPAVSYWTKILQSKWEAYAAAHGVTPNDIYTAGTAAQRQARGEFLRGLDQAYFNRLKTFVRNLGVQKPIEFSNLWLGESFQKMEESLSDVVEEHNYDDLLQPRTLNDGFNYFARSTPVGKPHMIGEFNQGQTDASHNANAPYRATVQLAASAYGAFNNWSGLIWFAWSHGDATIGNDGWSIWEERRPRVNSDMIGAIVSDGLMLDHLRTTGIMFKRGLVAPSADPITWYADNPLGGTLNYPDLMTPKHQFKVGWQSVHAIKRAFGPVPASQATAPWMTTAPTNPLVSDTNEIRKDIAREQLTVSAAQAEAFSGKFDSQPPAGLTHLGLGTTAGSATVILVANDQLPLAKSANLIISRTYFDSAQNELMQMTTTIAGLQPPSGRNVWQIKRTRPRGETGYEPVPMSEGVLRLPTDGWHEAELLYAPAGSLPPRQSLARSGDILRPVFDDTYRIAGNLGGTQGGLSAPESGFTRNAESVIDSSATFAPAEGKKSLRMEFAAGFDLCVFGFNFLTSTGQPTTVDLSACRATHGIRFWIYPKRSVSSFSVELACSDGAQLMEVRLPFSRYLTPADYGKWVEVTVPFADFPATDSTGAGFLWNQVKGVGFSCSTETGGSYDPHIDNLRLVRVASASPPATPR
jgi:hypothetical protein